MASASPTPPSPPCELCRAPANIICPSDDARLCWRCDSVVHCANFLVARHRRAFLCRSCASPTACIRSGARLLPENHLCSRCSAGSTEACCSDGSGSSDDECSVLTECESDAGPMSDGVGGRSFGSRRGKRALELLAGPACKRVLGGRYSTAQMGKRDDDVVPDAVSGIDDEVSSADCDDESSPVRPTVVEDVAGHRRGCRDLP